MLPGMGLDPLVEQEQQALPPWLMDELPLDFTRQAEVNPQQTNEQALSKMQPKRGGKQARARDLSPAIRKMLARNKNKSQAGMEFRDPYRDETLQWMHEQEV